jgi:hypothetical protein
MPSTYAKAVNDFKTTTPGHTAGASTLVLAAGAGARLGSLPANRVYRVTAVQFPETDAEIILGVFEATSRTGDTLNGVTGAEGFANVALAAGVTIEVRVTAKYISELQDAVDALETIGPVVRYDTTNRDVVTLPAGAPVAVHSTGSGVVAATAADNNHAAVGLVPAAVASLAVTAVVTEGPLTLADWTAVAGTTTLAARAVYYLSTTAGLLTTTPPSTGGQVVQAVGTAVAPDTLDVAPGLSILL